MKKRSPVAVLLLPFITFGIYALYWQIITKIEMNKVGAKIPTAWLLIIPIVNIWWLWKYCEGVEQVTNDKMSGVLAFLLIFLLGIIGAAIVQDSLNKVGDSAPVASTVESSAPAETGTEAPAPASPEAPAADTPAPADKPTDSTTTPPTVS